MSDDIDYSQIDEGVRDVVRMLRHYGFRTTDSGDGSKTDAMECAVNTPMVAIVTDRDTICTDADAVSGLLRAYDKRRAWDVEASYAVRDGVCVILAVVRGD